MPRRTRMWLVRLLASVVCGGLALVLTGCPTSGGSGDLLSPKADVRVTHLALPGGAVLAPVVSAGVTGSTTATAAEFPQIGVDLTLFNGVSLTVTGFSVSYLQEDGTPAALRPLTGFLAQDLQAKITGDTFEASVVTLRIPVVSSELRSMFAGIDGQLGTDDDFKSSVVARITIIGRDINNHTVSAVAQLSITARPQSS